MSVIKAIYTFIVGDMVILIGVIITIIVLALIHTTSFLTPLQGIVGGLLVFAVLAILIATLSRETLGRR